MYTFTFKLMKNDFYCPAPTFNFNFNFNSSFDVRKMTEFVAQVIPKDLTNTSLEEEFKKFVHFFESNYHNEEITINSPRELIALLKNYKGLETAERGEKQ